MSLATPVGTDDYLLSPEFLRKLEAASLATQRILRGRTKGDRRSARRGTSVEFADYRGYSPGDDLRYLDWAVYARLERMFIKLFVEEEDLWVYFLMDASLSMDFGTPRKLRWCQEAAAALGYAALCEGDRTQMFVHAEGRGESSRVFRGKGAATDMFTWLSRVEAAGGTDLDEAVRWFTSTTRAPGLTFVLSDLMTLDWEPALARLAAARGDCCVLHVLSPGELEPSLHGDLKLEDAETQELVEVSMGATVLRRYREARDHYMGAVRRTCHRYGFSYLPLATSQSVEEIVLKSLRRLQVVR
jgi:uncharacterized protein (DUF58 family)